MNSISNIFGGSRELKIRDIDICIETNGKTHHTSKFNLMTRPVNPCLVVRRGQAFKLDLILNRLFDASKDKVSFIFYPSDATHHWLADDSTVALPLLKKADDKLEGWHVNYEGQVDSRLMVSVTPTADCIVTTWQLEIDTKVNDERFSTYSHKLPIYIIFNPWCQSDTVYMPDETHRQEYIEEDGGLIFRGVYNVIKPTPWYYGQYEEDILDCALKLVSIIGKVKGKNRGDPIIIARALSAAVNAQDDNGVLVGNWSDNKSDYSDGVHPTMWAGSVQILQEYYKTRTPVKYAQCWVYAGVLNTVCRALGIPCRPVTCYNAAHDSEASITIDIVEDENGNILHKFTKDSIWNFHVWNEAWMDRPDIGSEFKGWQVIDATPQKLSENEYKCGPTSVKAVKYAEVQRPYDGGYVLSEVNADKVYWKYVAKSHRIKLLAQDTSTIGKKISTKAVGIMDREDLTSTYKFPDKSKFERLTMEKALRTSKSMFSRFYINEVFDDVTAKIQFQDNIKIGQDFTVVVLIKNNSSINKHQIKGALVVNAAAYTGKSGQVVKDQEFEFTLKPKDQKSVDVLVTYNDYFHKLIDQASFNVTCLARIINKDFDILKQEVFRVRNPDINISIDGNKPVFMRSNESLNKKSILIKLELENPLSIPLTNGVFYIMGTGIYEKIHLKEKVLPGDKAKAKFQITPSMPQRYQISAKFMSAEIQDIDGFLSFMVAPPK